MKMIPLELLGILLLLLIIKVLHYYIRIKKLKNVSGNIPGPTALPIVGNALTLGRNPHDLLQNLLKYTKQYGPTTAIWVGSNLHVYISHKEDVKVILSSTVHTAKGKMYDLMADLFGKSIFISDGEFCKRNRRIITSTLSISMLSGYLGVFNNNYKIMTDILRNEVGNDGFNVQEYFGNCSMDNIFDTTLRCQLHTQTSKNKVADNFLIILRVLSLRIFKFWLHPKLMFSLSSLGRAHNKSLKYIREIVKEEINKSKQRIRNKSQPNAFQNEGYNVLGRKSNKSFIELMTEIVLDPNSFMTDDQIQAEAITLIAGGHGTVTDTLSFVFYELARNQDIQNNVVEEINLYFGNDNRNSTYDDLQHFPYLERVIKETMRFYPFAYFGRHVKEDISLPSGYTLPSGSTVIFDSIHLHRDPEEFPDPERFNPDNFLPEHCARRHPYSYIPFSAGPRGCIGQKYAMLSMKCGIIHMLRQYKFLPSKTFPDIKLGYEILVHPVDGVHVCIKERTHMY